MPGVWDARVSMTTLVITRKNTANDHIIPLGEGENVRVYRAVNSRHRVSRLINRYHSYMVVYPELHDARSRKSYPDLLPMRLIKYGHANDTDQFIAGAWNN